MSDFSLTILQIFLVMLVILGFIYEDKLADLESKIFNKIKRNK